jgi:hemerythrin
MIAFIVWSPFYSVNNPEMDDEHKQIIAMINDMYSALDDNNPHATILGLLDRLYQYTQTHFRHEENLMQECGYPHLEEHKLLHELLQQKTVILRRDYQESAAPELLRFLKEWWVNHIQGEDKKYAPFWKVPAHA